MTEINDDEDIGALNIGSQVIGSQDKRSEKVHPLIRSFVRRQGRITESQKKAINDLWPQYGLALKRGLLDVEKTFARKAARTIVEIGFGNGHSLSCMAEQSPSNNYIGMEVHKPGVGSLLINIREKELTNIRFYWDDAVEVLDQCIGVDSLDGVQLFFPDPWHKRRHNKRRIIKPEFVDLISSRLKSGGYFHMATDWEDYAQYMMSVMSERNDFNNKAGLNEYSLKPDYRPNTKFEKRGERLGHGVWDLIFVKN